MALAGAFLLSAAIPAARAQGVSEKDLWLAFDFENSIEPSGGSAKGQMTVTFSRETRGVSPEGTECAANGPRFVKGFQGRGLYMGGESRNLLKPELADMEFPAGKVEGVDVLEGAAIEQVKTDDAWFGETCLKVQSSKKLGSGVSFPITVSGGGFYVFSLHVRGQGQLALRVVKPEGAAWTVGPEKSVSCSSNWSRHAVWVYATDTVSTSVTLATNAGERSEFFVDGVQLEKREKVMGFAFPEKNEYPYGKELSPGPWTPGRQKSAGDFFCVRWDQKFMFPIAEGSYSLWFKPCFARGDCEYHSIIERYYQWSNLACWPYCQLNFFRGKNSAEHDQRSDMGQVEVRRPEAFAQDQWCLLTVTWSNAERKSALYFNGELIGQTLSMCDSTYANGFMGIGNDGTSPSNTNGVLDNIRIYSRALAADEIKKEYEAGMTRLKEGK